MDRVAEIFAQKTFRRAFALVAFASILYVFRHLAILLVFFVTFERALSFLSAQLSERSKKLTKKQALLVVLLVFALVLGGLGYLGVGKTLKTYAAMQESFPEKLAALRENPLVDKIEDQLGGTEKIVESAKHYAGSALGMAAAIGHFLVQLVMGFVLAVVYVLEQEELNAFWSRTVDPRSLKGTLARWFGHVADATVVTVQLQLIVAGCNTLMTLPVLLIIGVPNVGALMILIFVSALVPVIGNVVSGTILCLLAYQQKQWLGVGVFLGLTFVLHKIESYYLSPRLTSRHVKIPGFLLIVSLIACEHLFGFKGFFLSFPILFVAGRIRGEMLEEDYGSASSPIDPSDSPDQLPGSRREKEVASDMELERGPLPLKNIGSSRPPPPPT